MWGGRCGQGPRHLVWSAARAYTPKHDATAILQHHLTRPLQHTCPPPNRSSSLIDPALRSRCAPSSRTTSSYIPPHPLRLTAQRTPAAMDQTSGAFTNMTSFLPSPADLLMVFPRLFGKASEFGDMIRSGGSVIAEPTMANLTNGTTATIAGKFAQESVAAAGAAAASGSTDEISMFQAFKNVASFFSYITSKWAIATFAIVRLAHTVSHEHY